MVVYHLVHSLIIHAGPSEQTGLLRKALKEMDTTVSDKGLVQVCYRFMMFLWWHMLLYKLEMQEWTWYRAWYAPV